MSALHCSDRDAVEEDARARGRSLRRRAAWPPLRSRRRRRAALPWLRRVFRASSRPAASSAGSASARRQPVARARASSGAARRRGDARARTRRRPPSRSPSTIRSIRPTRSASGRLHRLAGHAHLDRLLDADQPRQPLRAFGAGNDAEVDLGLPHLRIGDGDAVVAGHRHFEPAAERGAVQRHDDRLGGVLDALQQVVHVGGAAVAAPGQLLEPLDVGAGDERAAGADDDDRRGPPDRRWAASTAAARPSMTPGLSALTGGLSMRMTAISFSTVDVTMFRRDRMRSSEYPAIIACRAKAELVRLKPDIRGSRTNRGRPSAQ